MFDLFLSKNAKKLKNSQNHQKKAQFPLKMPKTVNLLKIGKNAQKVKKSIKSKIFIYFIDMKLQEIIIMAV